MVAAERWVSTGPLHSLPFLGWRVCGGAPNPKRGPLQTCIWISLKGQRTRYIKSPLTYTVQTEVAGAQIPRWSLWSISYLFFNQGKLSSDLCFSFWTEEPLGHSSPLRLTKNGNAELIDALNSVHFMIRFSQKRRRNRSHDVQWGRMFKIWIVQGGLSGLRLYVWIPSHWIWVWGGVTSPACISVYVFMKPALFYHSNFEVVRNSVNDEQNFHRWKFMQILKLTITVISLSLEKRRSLLCPFSVSEICELATCCPRRLFASQGV